MNLSKKDSFAGSGYKRRRIVITVLQISSPPKKHLFNEF
jgi:hypothetical protein